MSSRIVALLALTLACAAPTTPTASAPPRPTATQVEQVAADVAWLADPEREGRGLGTGGLAEAADWLAEALGAAGFEGAAADGGFLQRFRVPIGIDVAEASLRLGDATLEPGPDFGVLLASTNGDLPGDLVFAGFGISDESTGWDDYAHLDVEGKTVLVLDGRPGEEGDDPLGGGRGAAWARPAYKLLNARRHGAAAVLIAPARPGVPGLPGIGGHGAANPTLRDAGVLALSVSRKTASAALASSGLDLDGLQTRSESERMAVSTPLADTRIEGRVRIERREGDVANVVARLPGSDPALAQEAVVVGAHFDHLGEGAFGSLSPARRGEVHAGADDNASGTAALLAVARAFGEGPPPRRSLVLVAFTAEEAGLLGSAYYVEKPAVPIEDTVAMLNLDMVGRMRDDRLVVFGTESSNGLDALVSREADGLGVEAEFQDGAQGPSDQTSFASRGVPVIFFFTGTHPEYHTPDDLAGLVNAKGTARVAALTERVARALLDADERPEFAGVVSGHGAGPPPGGGGYGPYLGSVPAFGGPPVVGVRLSGVRPGSPAESAGLREGDVIVSFAGTSVRNLEEFAALLFTQTPGREIEIIVERDGERITKRATLGQRR